MSTADLSAFRAQITSILGEPCALILIINQATRQPDFHYDIQMDIGTVQLALDHIYRLSAKDRSRFENEIVELESAYEALEEAGARLPSPEEPASSHHAPLLKAARYN